MKYKAIICDVDGTLVPNKKNGLPSKKVISSISRAKQVVHVGIATARSMGTLQELFEVLQLNGPSIITGGAQILDPSTSKIYSQKILPEKAIYEISHIAKQHHIQLLVADYGKELLLTDNYKPFEPLDVYTVPISIEKAKHFIQSISHLTYVAIHLSHAWGVDNKMHVTISNPEATKQFGIFEISKILKIKKEEIIGIGEGYNDFPLLLACGLKIAMGNAIEELKEIADYIAPRVEEDGVADVIEKFIFNS